MQYDAYRSLVTLATASLVRSPHDQIKNILVTPIWVAEHNQAAIIAQALLTIIHEEYSLLKITNMQSFHAETLTETLHSHLRDIHRAEIVLQRALQTIVHDEGLQKRLLAELSEGIFQQTKQSNLVPRASIFKRFISKTHKNSHYCLA